MKGSVKNIGQKGNENRELYNNNLKVVNHMEKNINIAASGSEPETLQNQYLATKIALENNQEPKKQQKLTQACNKARKALEKYYYEQSLPTLPLQIHEMTEDEDTLLIQKIKQEIIIAFPVNGLKTKSAEIRSACSLLESEYFEPDELKIITPAGIFFDAGIELKDLNGNTIPEGTENVYCLAGDTKLHALVKAAYTLNIRAQTGEGETVILRNVRIREFDNIREYGRYIRMNNSLARHLRLQEKTEIAEMAEPGEFTKRAFLNGRIDLSQAEAVIDVINAKNEYALKSSVGQLRGSVSKKIRELREKILYEIAFIESALDDPEHISLDGYGERLLIGVQKMEQELSRLIRSSANGRVVSEGIRTVILGKPNAGKSSLMNVLVGEDRAIVTDIAGTTRDILEEHIYLQGISLNVVDTAGIRSTSDVVEKIGVERAMEAARDADLIIYVVDGSRELDENDLQIMELIRERKAVVLLNKSDLEPVVSLEEIAEKSGHRVISISAKEETGIDQLEEEIKSLFYEGEIDFNDQILITNVRHAEALREAYDSIRMVENSIESGMPEDFFSIDLMNAYEKLGLIVGEAVEDDLVNEIFSKFCMGK